MVLLRFGAETPKAKKTLPADCPCLSGKLYRDCCRPFHKDAIFSKCYIRHKRHTSLMHISLNQRVYQDFSNSTSPWWFWSMSIATWDSNLKRWRKNFVRIHLRWCLSSWLEPDIRRLLSRSTIFLLHLGKTEPETQTAGHHVESLLSFLQPE